MSIIATIDQYGLLGRFMVGWFIVGFIAIVYLAPRKTEKPLLTIIASTVSLLVPVIGLLVIAYLATKETPASKVSAD